MDMPMDYHVWGAMLEHYRVHMPKLTNIMLSCKQKIWAFKLVPPLFWSTVNIYRDTWFSKVLNSQGLHFDLLAHLGVVSQMIYHIWLSVIVSHELWLV